jgi:hypothetical protein
MIMLGTYRSHGYLLQKSDRKDTLEGGIVRIGRYGLSVKRRDITNKIFKRTKSKCVLLEYSSTGLGSFSRRNNSRFYVDRTMVIISLQHFKI